MAMLVITTIFPRIFPGVETPPSRWRRRRAAAIWRSAAAEQRPRGTRGGVEAILAATHARRGHTHSDTWDETLFLFFFCSDVLSFNF
jgi:hypothetical protein